MGGHKQNGGPQNAVYGCPYLSLGVDEAVHASFSSGGTVTNKAGRAGGKQGDEHDEPELPHRAVHRSLHGGLKYMRNMDYFMNSSQL